KRARSRWRRSARITAPSRHVEQQGDRSRECPPCPRLLVELLPAGARQRVELGAAIVLGRAPLRLDPAAPLQPVERRIQRSLLDAKRILRDLLNPIGDRPAVLRLEGERFENQEVERALR